MLHSKTVFKETEPGQSYANIGVTAKKKKKKSGSELNWFKSKITSSHVQKLQEK